MKHFLIIMAICGLLVPCLHAAQPMTDEEVALHHEYNERVLRMGDSAASHIELAEWCREHGLLDQAKAHLESALVRDPENAEAEAALRVLHEAASTQGDSQRDTEPVPSEPNKAKDMVLPWKLSDSAPPTALPDSAAGKAKSTTFSETQVPSDNRGGAPGDSETKGSADFHGPCVYVPAAVISIAGLIWILARVLTWHRRRALFRAINIAGVDSMNGWHFESYVADLLHYRGWKIHEVTSGSGDYGVDIVASKDNARYAVQVKRHSHKVGQDAIREVVAGMSMYKCAVAMVVTNNYFSPSAKRLAAANRCVLVDRNALARWIAEARK